MNNEDNNLNQVSEPQNSVEPNAIPVTETVNPIESNETPVSETANPVESNETPVSEPANPVEPITFGIPEMNNNDNNSISSTTSIPATPSVEQQESNEEQNISEIANQVSNPTTNEPSINNVVSQPQEEPQKVEPVESNEKPKSKKWWLVVLIIIILGIVGYFGATVLLAKKTIDRSRDQATEDLMYGYVSVIENAYELQQLEGKVSSAERMYTNVTGTSISNGEVTISDIDWLNDDSIKGNDNVMVIDSEGKVACAIVQINDSFVNYRSESGAQVYTNLQDAQEPSCSIES